jgi:hypothetical protein
MTKLTMQQEVRLLALAILDLARYNEISSMMVQDLERIASGDFVTYGSPRKL